MSKHASFEYFAEKLEQSQRYKILRRIPEAPIYEPPRHDDLVYVGAIVDTETTGLSPDDELIEIAIVRFEYGSVSGRLIGPIDTYTGLQQPCQPLSATIRRITGLTDEMLEGRVLNAGMIGAVLETCQVVIAHNADFDRRACERTWPRLPTVPWACSMSEIDWAAEGAAGKRLADVLGLHGLFHAGHRAAADAQALLHALSLTLPFSGEPTLAKLLASARRMSAVVVADGAPFDASRLLRSAGYRWNPANPKGWWRIIAAEAIEHEIKWLNQNVYQGDELEPLIAHIGAADRYRSLRKIQSRLLPASIALDPDL